MDIYESVTLDGAFVSESWADMELKYSRPDLIRWNVETGDQIRPGQVIGTYRGNEVTSELQGIILSINLGMDNAYIRVRLLEPVLLECDVTQEQLKAIQRGEEFSLSDGTAVALEYVSLTRNQDDTTTVRFSVDSDAYQYGQQMEGFALYTGVYYPQVLVVEESCVYQKEKGEDNPWYARVVTEDGYYMEEIEVQVNGNYNGMVRISGERVEEGIWLDSGYKAILGGQSE